MSGSFITFEGGEGSGKSTQCQRALDLLSGRGLDVVLTREPGATAIGRRLRELLLDPQSTGLDPDAELLLYCADRAEHVAQVIRPALAAGKIVLCDRFSDATRAYQGIARGLGLDRVARANLADFSPDLTILFDVTVETGLARARGRNRVSALHHEARFDNESLDFHERVRGAYLAIAAEAPFRMKVVDAERGIEATSAEVADLLFRHLGIGP